jgi:orotate phosphoribosyltransferase
MNLLPSQDDVIGILRDTGALRDGHFEYANGLHSNEYLEVPLAMSHYQHAKMLSVGLSRLLRANSEIRPMIPQLSIVSPATGGLPVAYGICEALQAKRVYWTERDGCGAFRFRPFIEPEPGEHVMMVDDVLQSGVKLAELRKTLESAGAIVIGLAVVVHQPTPQTLSFGDLPFYSLAKRQARYYTDAASCEMCANGQPLTKVWI